MSKYTQEGEGNTREDLVFYIERLTAGVIVFSLLPYIIGQRFREHKRHCTGRFFDASPMGLLAARCGLKFFFTKFERLDFRLIDIVDETGLSVRLRVESNDLMEVQKLIFDNKDIQKALQFYRGDQLFEVYLKKEAVAINLYEDTIGRLIFLMQVVVWKNRMDTHQQQEVIFFVRQRVFMSAIQQYAYRYGVRVLPMHRFFAESASLIKSFFYPRFIWLKNIYRDVGARGIRSVIWKSISKEVARHDEGSGETTVKLGIEYNGNLHLKSPQFYSDLFFLQQSKFSGKDAVLLFSLQADPMNKAKYKECAEEGITPAILDPRATTLPSFPIFYYHPHKIPLRYKKFLFSHDRQRRYVAQQFQYYKANSDYWYDFFQRYNIKLFLTWYKYDGKHISIANAIKKVGGVSVIYQRALEDFSSPRMTTVADVVFGFSRDSSKILRDSGSKISYHVVTGYIGDHRAPLLRTFAHNIRDELRSHGAQTIVAFFDENASADDRWHAGYKFFQENYAFLLEQVLQNPRLGLVLKPKGPLVLQQRLGLIAELLKSAEQTGRCKVIGKGIVHGSTPPVAAALAADIAIHGHLCAGTAGFEAALAGIPTVLLDREFNYLSVRPERVEGLRVNYDTVSRGKGFEKALRPQR